jgi:signal transduction histidine kinase
VRQRIARELHDDLGQKIALVKIELDQLADSLASDDSRSRMLRASEHLAEISRDVHNLSHDLHPSNLLALGLAAAMEALCRDVTKKVGVIVHFSQDATLPPNVDPTVSLSLYRILQEALSNVAKHSHAREAWVELTRKGADTSLSITDAGIGFDSSASPSEGLGLLSIRERVGLLMGALVIQASPGAGTRIDVRIPLKQLSSKFAAL